MIHQPHLTRERIKQLLATRRASVLPRLEHVVQEKIHCLTENHFGDIDDYNYSLIKRHSSGATDIRVVALTSGDLTSLEGEKERALCWSVLQKLNQTKKAGTRTGFNTAWFGQNWTAENLANYDLKKYQNAMAQDRICAIVPVLMHKIPDNPTRETVHQLAENLADGPIRILCLWNRSLGPTSYGDRMLKVSFPTNEYSPIEDEELTHFLNSIDTNFKNAHHFDESFGKIWNRLIALEKVLEIEASQPTRVADALSQHLFEFLQREDERVRGHLSRMPNLDELKQLFFYTELPYALPRAASISAQRTLKRAEKLGLITLLATSKSNDTYDLNPALHADFNCNSSIPSKESAPPHSLITEQSEVKARELNNNESGTTARLVLPEFRPGASAASRLKTLLLLNQGGRIPMWLVSHPTMGGTSAFRVIRSKYRDPGHVSFINDSVSQLQAVEVHETLGAGAPTISGNMLDVSTQLITPIREKFAIYNPFVEPEFTQSVEDEVLHGSPSLEIMNKLFQALPNTPVWEYWIIWLLSVRLNPETIDRDLRKLLNPNHPKYLPGLQRIPHDKKDGVHECKSHADFDALWARLIQSKKLSDFVEEWANKIPRVEVNGHTFAHGLDWYIYTPK